MFPHGFVFKTTLSRYGILDNFIFLLRKAWLLRSLKNSLHFYKYPLIHFYHKSLPESQSFVSGRNIHMCCFLFFFSGCLETSWALASVLWIPNFFCLKSPSEKFYPWIHLQTSALADFHFKTKLKSLTF